MWLITVPDRFPFKPRPKLRSASQVVLLMVIFAGAVSCGANTPPVKTIEWEYGVTSPEGRLTLQVPESWGVEDDSEGSARVSAVIAERFGPGGSVADVPYHPYTTVSRLPRVSEEEWGNWQKHFDEHPDDFREAKRSDITLDGKPVVMEEVVRILDAGEVRRLSLYVDRGEYTWLVSCIGQEGDSLHRAICGKVVESLKLVTDEDFTKEHTDRQTRIAEWRDSDEPLSVEDYIERCAITDKVVQKGIAAWRYPESLLSSAIEMREVLEPPPPELARYHRAGKAFYEYWERTGQMPSTGKPDAGRIVVSLRAAVESLDDGIVSALIEGGCISGG